ncbi:MAG TPA: head GIN domain-containing protein, partial [Chitinophagaceae bacterium]
NFSERLSVPFPKQKIMKKFLLPIVLVLSTLAAVAQKTINDPNAETRTVSGFHGIDVATGIKLILTEGNTEAVAVSAANAEHRDKIVTKVENGILKIYYDSKLGAINKKNESKNLRAYVSYKKLDQLNVTTGAAVEIEGVLSSSSLKIKGNTGGSVTGKVDVTSLTVSQSTGSKITLTGKADSFEADGDTGSKFFGEDLQTSNCSAKMSTGAGIYITVQKELSVNANTGGYVKYKGDAGIRDIKTSTGGKASKI